ncbi:ninjurin-2 isoform X6 [Cephus cinctus]|uniref:Ninjurin-2 isoform X6 n=1 Tax=Cephus cinctus TaxID=211228 RepID=A0AAJ7FR88_CEPCN|nr:ninjurin-2 isoform X6 [Cephus cinctus]
MATTTVSPMNAENGNMSGVKSLDANRYATKKTIAQGMLDIALLTANASQLKYILQVGTQHEFYILMLSLICVSIGLQAVVGILYLIVGGLDINRERDHRAALILNDLILVGVFLISLVNVLVSGFGMEHSNQPLQLLTHRMERTEET